MKKVLVKIFDTKYIPGVGKGPFIDPPVAISQSTLRNLTLSGIKLIVVDKKDLEMAKKETVVEEVETEADVTVDDAEEVETEEITDEADEETESFEEDEVDYEKYTIKELKTILDEAGVDYAGNALKKELIDLVKKI